MIDVDLSLLIKGNLTNVQMMSKYVLPSPPLILTNDLRFP